MKTTVVMPVYGGWQFVQRALAALGPELGDDRELVIVDDASPDETPDRVESQFPDVRLLRSATNQGFGPACNRGAQAATGRYLCFVNSDTIVRPGALEALEETIEGENVGATVASLVDEDGTLHEAGWTIGGDGVPFPLGRGAAADDDRWAFRREVDYGSAACLLIRTDEFREHDGFDDAFAPGYYEDADLCARLADSGRRTMLEPTAQAVHLQFGSGSPERAKSLVRRNRVLFLERWADRYTRRPFVAIDGPAPYEEIALRDAVALTRFLVVDNPELARAVAEQWKRARVTLLGAGEAGSSVETAHPDNAAAWLEDRRFHYSAVLGDHERLRDSLGRSQPQAFEGPTELVDDLVGALAAGGIAPPGAEPRG